MINKSWLKEGAVLQDGKKIWLACGPFKPHKGPHPSKPSFYSSDFFSLEDNFLWSEDIAEVQLKDLCCFLKHYAEKPAEVKFKAPARDDFQNQFEQFQKSLQLTKLKKAVPVFFAENNLKMKPSYTAYFLESLFSRPKEKGFIYGMWNKGGGFLGKTPEYLFRLEKNYVQTMALAGTAKAVAKADLRKDPKETAEHHIVVQGILSSFKEKPAQQSNMYEDFFGSVKHLRTDFVFHKTSGVNFLSLYKTLHPTPALGGFPKEAALQWLLKYNKASNFRKNFGSSFGIHFPKGEGLCLTAIRNIQWNQTAARIGSGAGWTEKSQAEKEWRELKLKRKEVMKMIGL